MIVANTWELFLTSAPYPACAPFSNNNVTMTYRVSGTNCPSPPYPCGTIQPYGEACSDDIQPLITEMINYFRTHSDYNPLMTDADTVYVNGVLYYSPSPTHYISLSMGFVPRELMVYFQTYISAISDNLMKHIASLPSPWVYLKTTYDGVTNSFNIWLYLPATAVLYMSPGALQDLYDMFTAWAPLVTGILLILIAAFGPFGVLMDIVLLFAGLVILGWQVYDARSKQKLAETKATNLTIQLEQNNKEEQARSAAEDIWNKSAKTQGDCITRLQSHRDIHLAKLSGFLDQYAKYPGLVTELNKEKDTFTTNANGIITEFKTVPYTASACDTYFVRMNSEIGRSNIAVNDSLGRYIKPEETYSVACKGWTNQAACQKAECFWYDNACHQEEACWVSNPLGGCILSAKTGRAVVGATAAIFLTAAAYWLFTRKKEEVISIYAGAKEAAAAEAERAKAAYRAIRPPAVPRITGAPVAV